MEVIVVNDIWFEKSVVLIHVAAKTWNHAWYSLCICSTKFRIFPKNW